MTIDILFVFFAAAWALKRKSEDGRVKHLSERRGFSFSRKAATCLRLHKFLNVFLLSIENLYRKAWRQLWNPKPVFVHFTSNGQYWWTALGIGQKSHFCVDSHDLIKGKCIIEPAVSYIAAYSVKPPSFPNCTYRKINSHCPTYPLGFNSILKLEMAAPWLRIQFNLYTAFCDLSTAGIQFRRLL